MAKLKLFDCVALTRDLPEFRLRTGDIGTVLELYNRDSLEVEFTDREGDTVAVLTLHRSDVRKPTTGESEHYPDPLPKDVEPAIADATVRLST
jgi:hypothetical protein